MSAFSLSLSLDCSLRSKEILSLFCFSAPYVMSRRPVTKVWESHCWETYSASKLLGESVAPRQVTGGRVTGIVALYDELPSDKASPSQSSPDSKREERAHFFLG
jgi:hypothetical protein